MKKSCVLLLVVLVQFVQGQTPFNKGVNLTSWFQAGNAKEIQFTKYTKRDFVNIKSLGCDVIRLPINLHLMTNGKPNYTLDPLFIQFLDQAVNWAEELDLHLILDNHSFDPDFNTSQNIGDVLIPVWRQMAEHFKNRSNKIYYEILNEPHDISNTLWSGIQLNVINAIREIDSVHTIVVGPSNWNSYTDLKFLPIYPDSNLIYTFHFYDPFIFTHQGASWTNPSMVSLANIPFPYSASEMPSFPEVLNGTWIQSLFNNYKNGGTISEVKKLIDIATLFQQQRNVPIFCGEFGVYIPNSNYDDRVEWYRIVREYFEEKGIAWTIFDYQGGFGLFNNDSDELFDHDLNIPLIMALGFNEIAQSPFVLQPDTVPFPVYTDYVESAIDASSLGATSLFDFYSTNNPLVGNYCLEWINAAQYNTITFDFKPDKDLSYLVKTASDLNLKLSVKGDTPGSKIDIRFLDSKTDVTSDHPWRIRYTLQETDIIKWNGEWQQLSIPFSKFVEHGAWDNSVWYEPIGQFDWSRIDKFEIVAEHQNLTGIKFWFDDIKLESSSLNNKPNIFNLEQNYPNPFNSGTVIKYSVPGLTTPKAQNVVLQIFSILGERIQTLVDTTKEPGNYTVNFDGSNLSSGFYIYQLQVGDLQTSKKMMLVR